LSAAGAAAEVRRLVLVLASHAGATAASASASAPGSSHDRGGTFGAGAGGNWLALLPARGNPEAELG
jgi:hypothetical protein